ncbi:hypothetical protein C8Q76DRAFT_796470 [Earliella scabrosa]|nr:hypothetical protein C8Q76DRAFT_796470 [Earliella scabrosa]
MATELPANNWFQIPHVVFATTDGAYALNDSSDWIQAYICVIELKQDRYGLLVCETLECKLAPNPTVAQVGLVLDENITMKPDPDTMVVSLRITATPTLLSIVPLETPYTVVNLRFETRMDYLSCVKAITDAEIEKLADREEKALTLRRALTTAVPRHAAQGHPHPCELHRDASAAEDQDGQTEDN